MRKMSEVCNIASHGDFDRAALIQNLQHIWRRIENATKKAEQSAYWRGRKPSLVAASKTKPASVVELVIFSYARNIFFVDFFFCSSFVNFLFFASRVIPFCSLIGKNA